MDQVVRTFGEGVEKRGNARDPDDKPPVEGNVDLGHGREAAVDSRVGADDVHVVARHSAFANLVDASRDPVHATDRLGDERDAWPSAAPDGNLRFLLRQDGGGRHVRDHREARAEEPERGCAVLTASDLLGERPSDCAPQCPFVRAPGAAVEILMGERVVLQQAQQRLFAAGEADRVEPRPQEVARILGAEPHASWPVGAASRRIPARS